MYYGMFDNWDNVISKFNAEKEDLNGIVPLFAAYDCADYDGQAFVLYVQKGKFWIVSASHCSCYGLENQWDPEEMPYKALKHLAEEGNYVIKPYKEEFMAAIDFVNERGFDDLDPKELEFMLRLSL